MIWGGGVIRLCQAICPPNFTNAQQTCPALGCNFEPWSWYCCWGGDDGSSAPDKRVLRAPNRADRAGINSPRLYTDGPQRRIRGFILHNVSIIRSWAVDVDLLDPQEGTAHPESESGLGMWAFCRSYGGI